MHILTTIVFMPLLGALALGLVPANSRLGPRVIAAVASGGALIAVLWLWVHFNTGLSELQFIEKREWVSALSIRYFLGVDGLSLPMLILTTALSFFAVLASFNVKERASEYFFYFLVLESA